MPWNSHPDFWGILGALVISAISGFISISRRILFGHVASILWILSEILTAILCGYLTFHTYPYIEASLPEWASWPVCVAFAAHVGGRIFQESEKVFLEKVERFTNVKPSNLEK